MTDHQPYVTIRSRRPAEGPGSRSTGPSMVRLIAAGLSGQVGYTYTI
jgi:hypothetical protein